jgi:hypothetical protein
LDTRLMAAPVRAGGAHWFFFFLFGTFSIISIRYLLKFFFCVLPTIEHRNNGWFDIVSWDLRVFR